MAAAICGSFFRYLGVEEGRAASCGKPSATGAAVQQAHAIMAIHCTTNEVVLARLTKLLACCIATG
jgi:hypothetical protein